MAPTSDAAARAGDATAPPVPSPARGRRAPECFDDPHFLAATREMQALGLRVMAIAHAGSAPFDAVAGRMQLRWYLVPAGPRAVSVASLALMQPLRQRARIGKRIMAGAAMLGLPHLWRRSRVHVSGTNRLAGLFAPGPVHAAFLTGTAGPHRKLTVQCMDADGRIRGYAKVAGAGATQARLANEAGTLGILHELGLRSAVIPRVLSYELRDGTAVLATDSADARHPACRARLEAGHVAFLEELAQRTASLRVPDGETLLLGLHARMQRLPAALSDAWRQRFGRALRALALAPELVAPRGLAHGDFAPGNTFRCADRVCVFDWEYAGCDYPADYDLIRFLLVLAALRRRRPVDACRSVEAELTGAFGRNAQAAR
ncbi:MAG: phosphotransferase, partial [Rhodanobacteraceae bacterium]